MSIKQYPGGFITKSPTAPTTAAAKGIWTLDQVTNFVKQGIWPRTPGAPTIGTATAGVAEATVAFTVPTDLGAGAITYTATSSPGGLTGTGASPITVTGLTIGTSYTFTVAGTTPGGTGPSSAASNSVIPTSIPAIGAAYGGGFFAGQISTTANGVATHNLVIGPIASAQANRAWKTSNSGGDPTSVIDGPGNTATMNSATYPAAQFCSDLVTGGFSDWYMPAFNELGIVYFGLKPTTANNATDTGINANSVPKRTSNYTTGNPAQTSATVFQLGGAEAFNANYWWSSTEASYAGFAGITGYIIDFGAGGRAFGYKTQVIPVRAVRRVAV